MELRELVVILRKEAALYGAIVLSFVVLGLAWHATQPASFRADILLNVGRSAGPVPAEYAYDSFYRLQADERFADTVTRWLAHPRVAEDIFTEAGLGNPGSLAGYFSGRRLSSQVIEGSFTTPTRENISVLAETLVTVLNGYAESLNAKDGAENWFRVVGSEPVITDARVPQLQVFLIALFAGLFIGFFVVLVKHYFKQGNAHRD